ncbi:MAG: ABC transporter permease subunit [Acidobacteriota bacterium]|nr:ABC transporter permease subunit [Acidobacteriota bacterium]
MPIHDQTYRRYTGTRMDPGSAWLVIARVGMQSMFSRKLFLWVMLAAWGQFFVRAVIFYLSANFPNLDVLAPSVETFRQFFEIQEIFVLFVTVYVGSGLIANDRRSNALQIYLSKPLTRAEYVAGKLTILLVLLLLVTLVPALALLVMEMMFSASLTFLRTNLFLIPAITLYALVEVLLAAFTMLALSSLTTSARYTAVLYAGLLFFTSAVFNILRGATGSSMLAWLSLPANLEQIGDVIFRLPPRFESPWLLSVFVVAVVIGLSALVLERRVRGVEVVT